MCFSNCKNISNGERSVIEELHSTWNLKTEQITGDIFTGYENVYDQLNYTKEDYDNDPENVTNNVFNVYRSVNLVPIIYYTESGIIKAIRDFATTKYNTIQSNVLGLGNNSGQTINRFLFPNMMTAEPKGRGSNSLKDRFYDDWILKRAIKIYLQYKYKISI